MAMSELGNIGMQTEHKGLNYMLHQRGQDNFQECFKYLVINQRQLTFSTFKRGIIGLGSREETIDSRSCSETKSFGEAPVGEKLQSVQ